MMDLILKKRLDPSTAIQVISKKKLVMEKKIVFKKVARYEL